MKQFILLACAMLLGTGCVSLVPEDSSLEKIDTFKASLVLPIDAETFGFDTSFKSFGMFVDDRFHGYHTGVDVEIAPDAPEVPVRAIADGTVRFVGGVSGYGGVVIIRHVLKDENYEVTALYGHLDLKSVTVQEGDTVVVGEVFGVLGEGGTAETDGERRHLHFGLYEKDANLFAGYVPTEAGLRGWFHPPGFFRSRDVLLP